MAIKMLNYIRGYTIFITGMLYIGCNLTGIGNWHGVLTIATVLIVLQCIPVTTGITRYVSYGLFFLGSVLLLTGGAGRAVWLQAFIQNGQVLTLIAFVPLMGVPLRFPKYRSALKCVMQRKITGNRDMLYIISHGLSHLLGSVVNLACLAITYQIMVAGTGGKYNRMLAKAALRGYGGILLWSPNSAAVAIVLAYWGHQLIDIMQYGLPLALLTLLVGWLENKVGYALYDKKHVASGQRKSTVTAAVRKDAVVYGCTPAAPNARQGKYMRQLVLGISSMLAIIIVVDILTHTGILTLVPVVALIFPILWSILIGDTGSYKLFFKEYLTVNLPNMANEATIFIGAGFFAVAVGTSPVGHYLPLLFKSVAGNASLVAFLTGAVIIGLSLIGFHPMLTTTSILTALTPEMLGLSFPFMAIAILGSFGIAVTCSPFSAGNLNVAALVGMESTAVSLRWQVVYSLLMFLVLVGYLNVLRFYCGI